MLISEQDDPFYTYFFCLGSPPIPCLLTSIPQCQVELSIELKSWRMSVLINYLIGLDFQNGVSGKLFSGIIV
jgi:hypothetical protein